MDKTTEPLAGEWYTADELAALYEVKPATVREWAKRGLIAVRPFPIRGKRYGKQREVA